MKVSVELGATLPVTDYGNVRPLIRLEDIDLDGDVEAQVKQGLDAASIAFTAMDEQLEVTVSEIISTSATPGFKDRLASVEHSLGIVKDNIRTVVTKVREMDVAGKVKNA